jgi:hypothetical protein
MGTMRLPLLFAAGLLALTGCSVPVEPEPAPESPTPVATPSPTLSPPEAPTGKARKRKVRTAHRRLDRLTTVERRSPRSDYERDAFGSSWADTDGNGCNQRDDVLLRDAVPGTVTIEQQGRCGHDVIAGAWIDPYTGRTLVFDDLKDLSQAQAIQIDHVVALSEAWVSGADRWSDERRRLFANDLDSLLAVDGPTNASKGDTDPAGWRPRKEFQCSYAMRWIDIKTRWDLSVDSSERRALGEMLDFC